MKRTTPTTFTASKFASLIGADRHEIARKLAELDARPVSSSGRGEEYSLRDLHNAAVGGDLAAERLRKLRAECDRLEHDIATKRREYVPAAAVKKLGEKFVVAVKNVILASPLPPEAQDRILVELAGLSKADWRGCGDS